MAQRAEEINLNISADDEAEGEEQAYELSAVREIEEETRGFRCRRFCVPRLRDAHGVRYQERRPTRRTPRERESQAAQGKTLAVRS